jgi:hypothetical protein
MGLICICVLVWHGPDHWCTNICVSIVLKLNVFFTAWPAGRTLSYRATPQWSDVVQFYVRSSTVLFPNMFLQISCFTSGICTECSPRARPLWHLKLGAIHFSKTLGTTDQTTRRYTQGQNWTVAKAQDLYLGGVRVFISARTQLSLVRFFMLFNSSSGKCCDGTSIRTWPLPSRSFPIHQSSYHSVVCSLVVDSIAK